MPSLSPTSHLYFLPLFFFTFLFACLGAAAACGFTGAGAAAAGEAGSFAGVGPAAAGGAAVGAGAAASRDGDAGMPTVEAKA
jgi:hypothetical protein